MTKYVDFDMTALNTEIQLFDPGAGVPYYIVRPRIPLDGVTPFTSGTWSSFNAGLSEGPDDVEVSIVSDEMLMQLKNDYAPWGLGRFQMDLPNAPDGTKTYMETKTVRLPAAMAPYEDYFATWYSFSEYRIGFNFASPPENDTQFQINLFTRDSWDYILFAPTINNYIFTTPPAGSYQNAWSASPSVKVPIDEDFKLQQIIRSDLVNGRWLARIKLEGEKWQTLWDYQGNTLHPDETDEDFRMMQPLKLYTNSTLVDWMNSNAGECSLACKRLQCWVGS